MCCQGCWSGLLVVIVVCVGSSWALPCLRWLTLDTSHDAGWGEVRSQRVVKVVLRTHSLRRRVLGEGALRGRSPRTREGRIGPTAQRQWSVVSGQ